MTFDIQEILEFLPHRYPFLLIDRITEFEPTEAACGDQKCDHQRAVFPGTFSGISHHAGRAGGGGDGAGGRHHHDARDCRIGNRSWWCSRGSSGPSFAGR